LKTLAERELIKAAPWRRANSRNCANEGIENEKTISCVAAAGWFLADLLEHWLAEPQFPRRQSLLQASLKTSIAVENSREKDSCPGLEIRKKHTSFGSKCG